MNINLHITTSIKRKSEIQTLITDAAQKMAGVFPLKDIDVVVMDETKITDISVNGNAFYHNTITMILSQNHLWKEIRKDIQPTFYHELHHLARIATVGYGEILEESIITEGLATAMEEEMGGNILLRNGFKNQKEFLAIYNTFKKERKNYNYDHSKWFFGDQKFLRWAGYKLGYIFISLYCKKTNTKPSQLFNVPAKDILNKISLDIKNVSYLSL